MDQTEFQLETPRSPEVVLHKIAETLRSNRSLHLVRPVLLGRIAGKDIMLWRSRRNGQSSLYPALSVSVRPRDSGSTLKCQFAYNSRAIFVSAVSLGTIGAALVLVFGMSNGLTLFPAAGAALLALVVLAIFSWASSRWWTAFHSSDRELLLAEFTEALRDEGV